MKFDNWTRNQTAITNTVYEKDNIICKQYTMDEFREIYGNNEPTILWLLKRENEFKAWNVLCFRKIEGSPIRSDDLDFQMIDKFVNTLKEFHNLPKKGINKIPFKPIWKLIKNYGDTKINDKLELITKKAFKIMKKDKVVVHNDLIDSNILKTKEGDIKFIDFEYSGISNKLIDIASFVTERKVSKENEEYFIKKYFSDSKFNKEDYWVIKMFIYIFVYKWASYKFETTKREIFNLIAKERYQSLIENKLI